jgi:copper chaperone CopZ
MRGVLMLMAILGILGTWSPSAAQTEKPAPTSCVLKIEGMACSACASRVERTALKITGVSAAKVSQPKGTAEITYDPAQTSPESIAKTITQKTGFKAQVSASKK